MINLLLKIFTENPYSFHYLRKIPEFNYNQTKKRIKRLTPRKDVPILDIGCGTGEYCRLFSSTHYIGIDVSDSYIRFAKKHYPEYEFRRQDGKALKFQDKRFDYVLINAVIHHATDIDARAILLEASRVLSPKGIAILIDGVPTLVTNILDRGGYLRKERKNYSLVKQVFKIIKREKFRSGVCDNILFVLKHRIP